MASVELAVLPVEVVCVSVEIVEIMVVVHRTPEQDSVDTISVDVLQEVGQEVMPAPLDVEVDVTVEELVKIHPVVVEDVVLELTEMGAVLSVVKPVEPQVVLDATELTQPVPKQVSTKDVDEDMGKVDSTVDPFDSTTLSVGLLLPVVR